VSAEDGVMYICTRFRLSGNSARGYIDRYLHTRLIVDLSAPARDGRESFCAPSNKESAVPSLLSNLIGLRKRCRLHFSPLLEALACGKLLPSERKPIILHGTIAIRNPPAADSTEIAPC
jgi:hypothetical protein